MRGERFHHIIVVEGKTGGAQAERVGTKVEFSSSDSGFKLGRSIAPIAKARQNPSQIRKKKDYGASLSSQRLLQAEVTRFLAHGTGLKRLKAFLNRREVIGSRLQTLYIIPNPLEIRKTRSRPLQKVRWNAVRGTTEHS